MASEKKGEGKANCTQVAPLCSTVSCTQGLSPPSSSQISCANVVGDDIEYEKLGSSHTSMIADLPYARLCLRNSLASRRSQPLGSEVWLRCGECKIGDVVTVDLGQRLFINHTTVNVYKLEPIRDILDRGEKQSINTTGEVYRLEPIRDTEETGGAGNWAHIIVGSVAILLGVLLVVPRNITVNIINGHGHNLPMTASIEGRNKFAISFFNFNGTVN